MEEKRHGGKGGSSNNGGNIKKNNKNIIKMLQDREIFSKPRRAFVAATVPHRFQNLRLSHQLDSHDPKHRSSPLPLLPFFMRRTKIVKIVAAKSIVFVLAHSGLCTAFSSETTERICFMNVCPGEIIKSIGYNKNNDSLIRVSVYASGNLSSWKFRSTSIEYIRRAKPDAGFHLFQSDSIQLPEIVIFDDINARVLTYSAQDSVYKVFDLKNYTLLYSFSFRNAHEIKISPGIMLLIFERESDHIPIKFISIEDGIVLKVFYYPLYPNKKVEFIEQFNETLLVKQENEYLQILDLPNSKLRVVGRTEFLTPAPFTILYGNQVFLTLRNRTIFVWNFRGELVTSLEDHLLWHRDFNINNIHITSDEDLIISYCKAYSEDQSIAANMVGSINVSNILSGKCVAKINAAKALECVDSTQMMSIAESWEGITALYYDEDRNELYAGNIHGIVHVWSNQLMKKKN